MILDLAERDAKLFRRLELASAASQQDSKSIESFYRKAIEQAVRTRSFIEYDDAGDWASGVETVLEQLSALVENHAALAFTLADHAFAKIEAAIENIDDSDGHGGALLQKVVRIHHAACQAAPPDPIYLAKMLFTRETDDQYGFFSNAAENYADALGRKGLAEYQRLAAEAWRKLPPLGAGRGGKSSYNPDYDRLSSTLDFFAQRSGDLDMRIALRSKDLSSPMKYLQLAQFCLSAGHEKDALRRAEEAPWLFEDDRPDERLIAFAVRLMVKNDRKGDAAALVSRAFDKAPSLALYGSLKALGDAAAQTCAIAGLERAAAERQSLRWRAHSALLIEIHITRKDLANAWSIFRRDGAGPDVAEALAKASEASHPAEAVEVYTDRVEDLAGSGGYPEAAALVARVARLRGKQVQAAYVADLKARHGRKRNFMKLLG
jgi:hypothetical protein